jgi:single-stranded-DNA-specific exonuclease
MVAFKLIMALIPNLEEQNPELYEELVSLATIGTIADVMELMDENRYYVKKGLQFLSNPRNIGLRALVQKLNLYEKELSADSIGFAIGPCINAAGRLKSADIAANLILSDDPVEAGKLADKLIKINEERKDLQKSVINQLTIDESDDFIIVNADGVGHGILGIIAGKIAEKYQKPCFVLGGNEQENKLSGSGRSVYGYDINSCVQANKDIAAGGGHSAACGVGLKFENLAEFRKRCNEHFRAWLDNASIDDLTPSLDVVCEIELNSISERLISNLTKLEPYGAGNDVPVFATMDLNVDSFKIVGKNANVIQMVLSKGGCEVKAVGFENVQEKYEEIGQPSKVDVIYTLELNEWPKGVYTPQLKLQDIRISE